MPSTFLWTEVLKRIKKQGVKETGLLLRDGITVMEDAIASLSNGVAHQLCTPHFKHCRETCEKKIRNNKKYLGLE